MDKKTRLKLIEELKASGRLVIVDTRLDSKDVTKESPPEEPENQENTAEEAQE